MIVTTLVGKCTIRPISNYRWDQPMARKSSPRFDYPVYLVIRSLVCLSHAVPPAVAFWLSDRIAWLLYRFVPSRRRVALENLTASFPELTDDPARAEELVRRMYRHFIRAVFESVLLTRKLHLPNWRSFIDLYPATDLPTNLFSPRSVLIVTGHFGNWEMAGYLMGRLGFKSYAIARVLDNPHLERLRVAAPAGDGPDHHPKTRRLRPSDAGAVPRRQGVDAGRPGCRAPRRLRRLLRPTGQHAQGDRADGDGVRRGDCRDRRAAGAPSRPSNAAPMPGMEATFYAVEVEETIDPRDFADRPDAVKAITQRYTSALERLIRRHPEQYFWLHRRWKHQPAVRGARRVA